MNSFSAGIQLGIDYDDAMEEEQAILFEQVIKHIQLYHDLHTELGIKPDDSATHNKPTSANFGWGLSRT
ncbi:YecA/YgfB family protein [Candidatus Enterovibrio escicola]|uniref:Uncharacterized protein n=1 Tax=Candidatus Enterovibrio escicola TaxID=1927127 RepID=A0A2A5T697_9GAMM|nr:hypothetical protein [Candidatus Enterovibrio escacola]PCS23687.1 hypothetical protein BTN49_0656 [Candidatus Enterovibrio escacola]